MEHGPHFLNDVYVKSGYTIFNPSEELSGIFSSILIYRVRGFSPPEEPIGVSTEREHKLKISFGLSKTYKQAASAINEPIDDNDLLPLNGSENPSVLVIHTTNNRLHQAQAGYHKKEDRIIYYEPRMFAGALAGIKHDSSRVLPAVLESLAIAIGEERDLYFTLLKTIISGQSSNGIHLRKAPEPKLVCESFLGLSTQALQNALDSCAQRINKEIRESSFFFSYGLTERDTAKRFLLFYLSIEHWLGEIFGDLSKTDAGVAAANILNESLGEVESKVLWQMLKNTGRNDSKGKFVLGMKVLRPDLSNDDLRTFIHLHRTRANLAHGKTKILPSEEDARMAYVPAAKLLSEP